MTRRIGWRSFKIFAVKVSPSVAMVTSTRAPFLSFTSSPCSSVREFSIRRFRYLGAALSTAIWAFSGCFRLRDRMILATFPGIMVLDCSGVRPASSCRSMILADLAIRGRAISFLTLARNAPRDSFFGFFCSMYSSWHPAGSQTASFRTVPKYRAANLADRFHLCRGCVLRSYSRGLKEGCGERRDFARPSPGSRPTSLFLAVGQTRSFQGNELFNFRQSCINPLDRVLLFHQLAVGAVTGD